MAEPSKECEQSEAAKQCEQSEAAKQCEQSEAAKQCEQSETAENCELCEAAKLTEWFHEDDRCWIAECEACWVPMVVWRSHGTEPPADDVAHMQARLAEVGDRVFGTNGWFLDDNMRQIPDHYHAHVRKKLPWMS